MLNNDLCSTSTADMYRGVCMCQRLKHGSNLCMFDQSATPSHTLAYVAVIRVTQIKHKNNDMYVVCVHMDG